MRAHKNKPSLQDLLLGLPYIRLPESQLGQPIKFTVVYQVGLRIMLYARHTPKN
jgi:hypothetical protein